jgi:N-acetyl-anhydromuramyl-L-alanine amidase AmpD
LHSKKGTPTLLAFGLLITIAGLASSGRAAIAQENSLEAEFQSAAEEYGVPVEVLKAMGYVNTRWEMPPPQASNFEEGGPRDGSPENRGSYGTMNLMQNPSTDTLQRAADLTGSSEEALKSDRASNIRGSAAVLADLNGEESPENLNGWFDAVSDYGEGDVYANQVYETLQDGASAETSNGETVTLEPSPDAETQPVATQQAKADYGKAKWYGANRSNYTNASRGRGQINKIVIHVTQGSFSSAINWFKTSGAQVSAHYTVRSSDGFIGQSVREQDISWHAGNWNYNKSSIGIEHEGYVGNSSWFTNKMYHSSARLAAYESKKYGIPVDRQHIIGHSQVAGASHTDPGRYWNWSKYMRLVKRYRKQFSSSNTTSNTYQQIVDNASNRFRATQDWGTSTYSSQKAGKNYRYITPKRGTGSAKFIMKFPARDNYAIYARWPANSGYNGRARFLIKTSSGWKLKIVNQRRNGGKWVHLGNYNMSKGNGSYVRLAKRSTSSGYVMADATLIRRR